MAFGVELLDPQGAQCLMFSSLDCFMLRVHLKSWKGIPSSYLMRIDGLKHVDASYHIDIGLWYMTHHSEASVVI